MKQKNKQSHLNIVKAMIQAIFFVLLPGLYVNAFLSLKLLYEGILKHNLSFSASFVELISVIAIIPITMLIGRFFCGWMCAFGTMGDFLYFISRKLFKSSFRMNEKADKYLKLIKYAVLLFIILAAWSFQTINISSLSPWDAFGSLVVFDQLPNLSYIITELTVGFLLLLAIMTGSLFIERFFCRYLCPLGAVFAIISRISFLKIKKPNKDCGACKACTRKCSMGIPLYEMNSVDTGECIRCMNCITVCPRSNAQLAVVNTTASPVLAGALAVTAVTGIYYIGSITSELPATASSGSQTSAVSSENTNSLYTDGTYKGSGTGFRNATTTVAVTIKGGSITGIEAVSYGDDRQFFEGAFRSIVNQIITCQSAQVDAVSGATFSSNGIMVAVTNALELAKLGSASEAVPDNSGDLSAGNSPASETVTQAPKSEANSQKSLRPRRQRSDSSQASSDTTEKASSKSTQTDNTTSVSSKYTDGVYNGSAEGFHRATTTVSVTVKDGSISDIKVISNGDTPAFFQSASSSVISDILDTQSVSVDTVSGATYSSMGIMNAVADALKNA